MAVQETAAPAVPYEEGALPAERPRLAALARLGRRRAEMIARNPKVEALKRAEKEEVMHWFKIWLDTPDAFFDWLELRKQSAEFQRRFSAYARGEE